MSERDLLHELRRVDDSFAHLKASRDDEMLAILVTDRVQRGAARGARVRALVAVFGVAAVATLAIVVAGGSPPVAVAVAVDANTNANAVVAAAPAVVPSVAVEATAPTAAPSTNAASNAASPLLKMAAVDVARPRALARRGGVELASAAVVAAPVVPQSATSLMTGVGDDVDVVFDEEVQGVLEQARRLSRRGDAAGAAAALQGVLVRNPGARVADSLGYERALLLVRAGDEVAACGALRAHAERFPRSENAGDVGVRLSRCP